MTTAICPGSFDPITLGHLDIIRRASRIFDTVVVCIMVNAAKSRHMFSDEERAEMVRLAVADLPNVRVDVWDGLLTSYAQKCENPVIVKGLRAASDFEYELQMNNVNKNLFPELETMFLTADSRYTFLSSSIVRELAGYGADISSLVPPEIIEKIETKIKQGRT